MVSSRPTLPRFHTGLGARVIPGEVIHSRAVLRAILASKNRYLGIGELQLFSITPFSALSSQYALSGTGCRSRTASRCSVVACHLDTVVCTPSGQ